VVRGRTNVRNAIDRQELVNFYQPKEALGDRILAEVESLVRWNHHVDGRVFPDQFIGVAEDHGFIDLLTRTMIALVQARRRRDAGL